MPNIIEQRMGFLGEMAPSSKAGDQFGIYLKASNGCEFVLTRRMVAQKLQAFEGTRSEKKTALITRVASELVAAIGPGVIDPADMALDFDDDTNDATLLRFFHRET